MGKDRMASVTPWRWVNPGCDQDGGAEGRWRGEANLTSPARVGLELILKVRKLLKGFKHLDVSSRLSPLAAG